MYFFDISKIVEVAYRKDPNWDNSTHSMFSISN